MSQQKTRIEAKPHGTIVVQQPMVRTFSTGGGHGPEDTLVEGDDKLVTKKWQGYPPENLNVVGKAMPPMSEVAIPRFTGRAEYATRVWFPDLLHAKLLTCPHARARVRRLDASQAERMPGVAHVLTSQNAPASDPFSDDLEFQGQVLAIVVADTEDQAEDAVAAIDVDYEVLPFAATLAQSMAPNAPDLRQGQGNLAHLSPDHPEYAPEATSICSHGDVEQGFREAEVIKEFTYYFAGAVPVPMQPSGCVARWEGDQLTFWGMGQTIYGSRRNLARDLGIDPENIRYINKWNGCTLGGANGPSAEFYTWIAHLAKVTGRPVRLMMPKEQELAYMKVKPEDLTRFKVGATKEGKIVALTHELDHTTGRSEGTGFATSESARNTLMLYTCNIPHWSSTLSAYKTNAPRVAASRSNSQQEIKWAWEQMMDEMAEAFGIDPIEYRLMHIAKPGTKLSPATDWNWGEFSVRMEVENGALMYDSYASVEVLEEGAKVIGWDQRNPVPGGNPGRIKRGFGVAMSQHHAGHMGYREGEAQFQKLLDEGANTFGAELDVDSDGNVTIKYALPDSGTNHATAMAAIVAEMLGFTTRDRMRVVWGDSQVAPPSQGWNGGKTTMLQGGALCAAAEKLRADLLQRAATALGMTAEQLQIRDGVIASAADPQRMTTFAELARAAGGVITQTGHCIERGHGRSLTKGVGACFAEVEVDTWTGDWRFVRAAYCHDSGLVVNPLVAEADMHGSLIQSLQMTTDALPWDREFPGSQHYAVGYLSYRLPTIMDVPEQTQVFVNSLEPRWFYGAKSFAETSIGSVPGVVANAIYNACGVRIREHPVTREKIMAGLKAQRAGA